MSDSDWDWKFTWGGYKADLIISSVVTDDGAGRVRDEVFNSLDELEALILEVEAGTELAKPNWLTAAKEFLEKGRAYGRLKKELSRDQEASNEEAGHKPGQEGEEGPPSLH